MTSLGFSEYTEVIMIVHEMEMEMEKYIIEETHPIMEIEP